MKTHSVSIVIAGSGGSGVITTGTMLLEAAAQAGLYAYMTRSVGAQIRGGEAAAMLRLSTTPVISHGDHFHILLALDWMNLGKYAAELPLTPESLIIGDPDQGDVPDELLVSGARQAEVGMKRMSLAIPGGRPNMVAMGVLAGLIGLPLETVTTVLEKALGHKGERVMTASKAALQAGFETASALPQVPRISANSLGDAKRWSITGNKMTGLGAIRGGVRFVAAYPITPATEVLEWMAPALDEIGGTLVQVEDELAAINQIIGASYGGIPSLTATAGPGLALMTESLGLAVASETPIVVVDVMRGGPSTGIPAKSEQSDLNIAIYGLHGDAPHIVLAPNSAADCLLTTQWSIHLAETLQAVCLVLSDQSLGQTQVIVDEPPVHDFKTRRATATELPAGAKYLRYALTDSGVSPMALPGTPNGQYTADGLEHTPSGTPSSLASDHQLQMDKRLRKLTQYDYGDYWADIEGEGDTAVITWGSCTGPAREALQRLQLDGVKVKLISVRLLSPIQPEKFAQALAGVKRALVIEQSHGAQFLHYLRAHYSLPQEVVGFNRPGPISIRPHEITQYLNRWN